MSPKSYNAPWGQTLRWVSLLVVVICVAVPGFIIHSAGEGDPARWVALGVVAIPVITALFSIRSYTIEPGALAIQRLLWTTRLPLAGLQSATLKPRTMRWSIRLCGNGGAFSFTGWFRNRELGVYRAFVTDLNRTVVLKYPARTIVVSPERPEEFVAEITAPVG